MKYNTISTSSLSSEGRKSTLTLYTDPDFLNDKVSSSESEVSSIRSELETVQRALKLQTRRCRQLVAEYTRRLQEKEQQYQSEKLLRDNQLTKVIRALLIFEARLKQEQKYISHQLKEKDYIIKKQRDDISTLSNQYCKHCNQYYAPAHVLESFDSSSEYVVTDYHDYQSSNVESLDSSSETYATISEKNESADEKIESAGDGKLFQKNKTKDSFSKRGRKLGHRKSVGTYFEVLKMRKGTTSPSSNDDNTSNDYENLESLPAESSASDKISLISERIETIFAKCGKENDSLTEDNVEKHNESLDTSVEDTEITAVEKEENDELEVERVSKITDSIAVFEGDGDANDNWYASASDQEDDEQRDVYRNNPVLECMNQILMQNINDNLSSPPKSPTVERRNKNMKRVKFSDEEDLTKTTLKTENVLNSQTYYETPVQKVPNFYETPQSIYSNDYEQILSNEVKKPQEIPSKPKENHYYVDMDTKSETELEPPRKSKIIRTPPALPPKPANLLSKYKIQNINKSPQKASTPSVESEPDYCSISELNLPPTKTTKKINVVAEINIPQDTIISEKLIILHSPKHKDTTVYESKPNKKDDSPTKTKPKQEIPKLPQVSEIIIPDENDSGISYDNYIKNNSQILKSKSTKVETPKRSILIGSSVSSIITGLNNQHQQQQQQQIRSPRTKLNKKMFSSFESLQNIDKQYKTAEESSHFDSFDLSQNFEEFKLDDCEISEYDIDKEIEEITVETIREEHILPDILTNSTTLPPPSPTTSTHVEIVRATNDSIVPQLNPVTINQLKKKLEESKEMNQLVNTEPSYEHFLECTGLSSKSILTPSRLLSNHKSMLKPKDVKLRNKVKSNAFERQSTMKYWSEPYI